MAFNNYFPTGYLPQYYPQIAGVAQASPQQPAAPQGGIIWVCGEAGAKSYLVAPNSTVQLWDSEAQTIYIKSADASGMPSIKVIDYTIRDAAPQTKQGAGEDTNNYVTKEEFNNFRQEVQRMVGGKRNESTVQPNKQHKLNQ